MPNLGSNMPKMGMKAKEPPPPPYISLADALFSGTQQRVLGLLFGQPERSFYATELIGLTGGGSGAVQRELARLEQSGLVTIKAIGNQKHYQANPASPIFAELCGISKKTLILTIPTRQHAKPPVEIYNDKRVREFDKGEAKLAKVLKPLKTDAVRKADNKRARGA